jgi:hypothetical protein
MPMPPAIRAMRPPSRVDHVEVLRDLFAQARRQNPMMHHTWLMAMIWKQRPERRRLDTVLRVAREFE